MSRFDPGCKQVDDDERPDICEGGADERPDVIAHVLHPVSGEWLKNGCSYPAAHPAKPGYRSHGPAGEHVAAERIQIRAEPLMGRGRQTQYQDCGPKIS